MSYMRVHASAVSVQQQHFIILVFKPTHWSCLTCAWSGKRLQCNYSNFYMSHAEFNLWGRKVNSNVHI